mmetsp:Transcript_23522/g.35722  ORF Transcript_23522/g.35722 Transcript_23522/m.35722 type:complete len:116 (-) Transcript_23522:27-374(-)
MQVYINVVSWDENVTEIERYIHTIKERVRGKYNDLPFNHYPPLFIIEMVFHSVFWRNMLKDETCTTVKLTESPTVGLEIDTSLHGGVDIVVAFSNASFISRVKCHYIELQGGIEK